MTDSDTIQVLTYDDSRRIEEWRREDSHNNKKE